jgi:hypothetical protein
MLKNAVENCMQCEPKVVDFQTGSCATETRNTPFPQDVLCLIGINQNVVKANMFRVPKHDLFIEITHMQDISNP